MTRRSRSLTPPVTKPTRAQVEAKARELAEHRTRYRNYGHSLRGCDCLGVAVYVGLELGLLPADFKAPKYSLPIPEWELFDKWMPEYLDLKNPDDMTPGDVLVLIGQEGVPRHIVIVVHALARPGKLNIIGIDISPARLFVTEAHLTDYIMGKIYSVYQYRGLED